MQKLKIIILICLFLLILLLGYINFNSIAFLNFAVLTVTLSVLIWYTYDTHRIAEQTVEANLRPILLRSGFINGWGSIKFVYDKNGIKSGTFIQFTIMKNIAKDIEGYLVIKGYKYKLLFGSNISKLNSGKIWFNPIWSWMMPNTIIYAAFFKNGGIKSKEKNKIYITYKDIAGNSYYTIENENFSQTSGKK